MGKKIGREDLALTIGILLFSIIVIKDSIGMPDLPRKVPLGIGIATALLCGIRLFKWRTGKKTSKEVDVNRSKPKEDVDRRGFYLAIASVVCYPLAILLMGIVFGTLLFAALFMYLLGARSIKVLALAPAILTLIIYLVFVKLLYIRFPAGIFFS